MASHKRISRMLHGVRLWRCAHCHRWKPRKRFGTKKKTPPSYCRFCRGVVQAHPINCVFENVSYLAIVLRFRKWARATGEHFTIAAGRAFCREMGEPWLRDDDEIGRPMPIAEHDEKATDGSPNSLPPRSHHRRI